VHNGSVHAQFGLQVRTRATVSRSAPGAHVAFSSGLIGYFNKVKAFWDVSQHEG